VTWTWNEGEVASTNNNLDADGKQIEEAYPGLCVKNADSNNICWQYRYKWQWKNSRETKVDSAGYWIWSGALFSSKNAGLPTFNDEFFLNVDSSWDNWMSWTVYSTSSDRTVETSDNEWNAYRLQPDEGTQTPEQPRFTPGDVEVSVFSQGGEWATVTHSLTGAATLVASTAVAVAALAF